MKTDMYKPIQLKPNIQPQQKMKTKNMTTPDLRKLISRSPLRLAFLLIPLALVLACFALSPAARAVLPAPDGGYPNGNTAEGEDALFSLTTGTYNTAIGFNALFNNATGSFNTAIGYLALFNSTADYNTAVGFQALLGNTSGSANTATGVAALQTNSVGSYNTANGNNALSGNTSGENNTATGLNALGNNSTGNSNTATGLNALVSNTTASENTADGVSALQSNTTGFDNTASGLNALYSNTIGNFNAANGAYALYSNLTGNNNTVVGYDALYNNTSGSSNIALGFQAGLNVTGNNNIDIGNVGVAGDSKKIRIGKAGTQNGTFIAGISGATVPTGVAVIIDASGHLGTTTSSARYKEAIKPMDKASEAILALKPVSFRYKPEIDPDCTPQFGLVAEDVEKVNRDLVARDGEGKVYTVRYDAVNAMLLNEFLKAHRRIEEQDKRIEELTAQLKEQAALIQQVNDKVELTRPAPQTVLNDQ